MACIHVDSPQLRVPTATQAVYREDCIQCFDSIDDPTGLDVCLYCFSGGCTAERQHGALHYATRQHPLVPNIRRSHKTKERDEPPQKISKLAILAETDADRYETVTAVRCYECQIDDVDTKQGRLAAVVDGVMKASTYSKQEEVKAWEQEFTPCEHTLMLQQAEARQIQSGDLGHCSMCALQENLWLCLECGNLGCGRAQFGGIKGHSHGLEHATSVGHGVAVKLGSITPEGTADVYCYKCNEERIDQDLPQHLAHWGINIADRQKTEQSLMEMQVDQNLRWDFSMTTEDGQELKPLFGPGFTGLKNLGNSCYLASSLQCLFALPQFQRRYYKPDCDMPDVLDPAQDLETQLRKVADGLLSGRYSHPESKMITNEDSPEVPHQKGIAPSMLKHLIGRGHAEFSTMKQQDAFELILHLFKLITRSHTATAQPDPTEAFRFAMEQRLQCLSCKKVKYSTNEQDNLSIAVPIEKLPTTEHAKDEYRPITIKECLDSFTANEDVELTCAACSSTAGFSKRTLFKTFPAVLAVNARRFTLINWVPTKVDVPVVIGDDALVLDDYMSPGIQPHEELLPENSFEGASGPTAFQPNQDAMDNLQQMGFPMNRCEKALYATGNGDANAAMEWLFAHMDDADIDAPLVLANASTSGATMSVIDPEKIEGLGAMGFSAPQARKALKETSGDMERAVDWLFNHPDELGDFEDDGTGMTDLDSGQGVQRALPGSDALPAQFELSSIVCHKGGSIHAGHYVAFIRKEIPREDSAPETGWVLFNDEKVVEAVDAEDLKKFAYVYFFQRAT